MGNTANFKVFQASAGSGKTYTIIKEYLKLCLKSEANVNNFRNILAITFTNAAANEMKAKIVNNLCEIIGSNKFETGTLEADLVEELDISDEQLKHNAQQLMTAIMHDYSSFCVSTIDAFVQKLSRSFAHDLGLPNRYSVSIDNDEVAETITQRIGLRISNENAFLLKLLVDFSNNQFDNQRSSALENQLADFIQKLMTEKAYQKDESNCIKNIGHYYQTLDFLNDKTIMFEHRIKSFVEEFKDVERRYALTTDDYWQKKSGVGAFVGKLEKKVYDAPNSYFYTALEKSKCLSDISRSDANEALLAVLEPLKAFYDKEHGKYLFYKAQRNLLYLYALRGLIRETFKQLADEEEVIHISEFNKLLNTVMGDFTVPFIYERIGERYRHVFIDEFQDTSIMQWQNLIPLIDNGLSAGQMSMVVGDGKQSIYRFRSGEVGQIVNLPDIFALPEDERHGAFMQFQENLRNNFFFKNLDTNYRSFSNVVEFNNAFFEAAITGLPQALQKVYVNQKPNAEVGVSIRQKTHKKEPGLVQIELYNPDGQPDYCFNRVEALIRDLTENRGYRYKDITLLTRRISYGSQMANYLNDRGIPVISQISILLSSSDKVQLVVSTLRFLMDESDELNIVNMLYYWRLVQQPPFNGEISSLFGCAKDVAARRLAIEQVMGIGEPGLLRSEFSRATCLYDLCSSLLRIFHLNTIRDAFINYFMEEVFRWQTGIKVGIAGFLTFWDKKQSSLSVKSAGGNAVKIMTIHKSKGLEFPVVIYPDAIIKMDEKLSTQAAEEWLRPQDLGFDSIPNLEHVLFKMDNSANYMGDLAIEHVEKEKEDVCLDNLNLLYVAFTRAAQCLYVIVEQGKADKPNLMRDFLANTALEIEKVSENDNAVVYCFGDARFCNSGKEKQEKAIEEKMFDSVSADWFKRIQVDASPTLLWRSVHDKLLPRDWGEKVHQILANIHAAKDMEKVLMSYLSDGTLDQESADWIREKFNQMAHNEQIAPAFSPTAKVKTECEILHQGEIKRLDRYAELSDAIYLLDYKTGKKDPKHDKQLNDYIEAIRSLTDKEIRPFLVYLADDRINVEQV